MNRWAVLSLIGLIGLMFVVPVAVEAQRGRGSGAAGRSTPPAVSGTISPPVVSGRTSPSINATPPPLGVRPGFPSTPSPIGRIHRPGIGHGQRPVVVAPVFGFYPPFAPIVPFYTQPLYGEPGYAPSMYSSPINIVPSYVDNTDPPLESSQREAELARQVDQLTQQVEQLRREQSLQQQPAIEPQSQPPAPHVPATPTILVFRDGRRQEIQNYAVVGQTLWIVDQSSIKIALSDLDLDATRKENQRRGLRFLPTR